MAASLAPSAASSVTQTTHRIARTLPFRTGRKQVYLPDFTVALKRTRLPPQYATFEVPLKMNKLDMRDYLWHAYSIRSLSITTRVLSTPVQMGRPDAARPSRTLFRPAPTKKMTVLMDKPFVWPEPPSDEVLGSAFNREQYRAARKSEDQGAKRLQEVDTFVDRPDREALREQARRLLAGKDKWRPPTRKDGNWAVRKGEEEVEATK